jgi:hypothetical protein
VKFFDGFIEEVRTKPLTAFIAGMVAGILLSMLTVFMARNDVPHGMTFEPDSPVEVSCLR